METLGGILARENINKHLIIKIDVQGYEYHILSAALPELSVFTELTILAEFWPYGITNSGGSDREFIRMFLDRGFEIFAITNSCQTRCYSYCDVTSHLPVFQEHYPDQCSINLVIRKTAK